MPRADYHLPPIPDGYQIYEARLEVSGLQHRRAVAGRFAEGRNQGLELEPEPENPHDEHAVRVIGTWKGFLRCKRAHIGYLPRQVAKRLADGSWLELVRPRLLKTYRSPKGYVEVLLQLIGPSEDAHRYRLQTVPEEGHYSSQPDRVRFLKKEGRLAEAEELLLRLIRETEEEAAREGSGWSVAPWYYEQLAIVYRKEKRYADEVAILERYASQPKAPGKGTKKLAARLVKARAKAAQAEA